MGMNTWNAQFLPPDNNSRWWIVSGSSIICKLECKGASNATQVDATAKLISATVDMYSVLKEILDHGTDDWEARIKTIRAAVDKAEGLDFQFTQGHKSPFET